MDAADTLARPDCRPEEAAAYLDGELAADAAARFERHARACAPCAAALNEQRRLLCLLDVAFGDMTREQPRLPGDFSRVVRARAQADVSGLRTEKKRALTVCAALALLAFALLGASAFGEALAPLGFAARAVRATCDVLWHTLTEAARGSALILRALGAQVTEGPGALRLSAFAGLLGAIVLLFRLISSYHRTRIPD
ncbi:MAG TPA: zf-HC2 domain-containing protein [Pyrinomonadaceae bacterium]|jgi:anti-sigma factor RsiW